METWVCRQCKAAKPESEFVRQSSRPSLRWCRECKASYDADYYAKTRDRRAARKRITLPALRNRNREYVWQVLRESGGCQDCGITDILVLEFDHRDPATKTKNIAQMIYEGYSIDNIAAEIALCDVVCANCHRRRTARQMGWRKGAEPGSMKP
jgi:hypothetical protein